MKKIDFNLLKSAIFGSVNTYTEEGVIKMRRFSDKQMAHFDDICKKYNVKIIDGLKLTPHCAEFYRPDGTHPNEIGFMQYGENLYRVIRKELENEQDI